MGILQNLSKIKAKDELITTIGRGLAIVLLVAGGFAGLLEFIFLLNSNTLAAVVGGALFLVSTFILLYGEGSEISWGGVFKVKSLNQKR